MNNAKMRQILENSGWLDNLTAGSYYDDVDALRQSILDNLANPDGYAGELILTEECFDEEEMYELASILESLYDMASGDVDKGAFRSAMADEYQAPQALFDDANQFLASQGVAKAFYILPRIDQMVFYAYKPIAVYQKALELGLPLDKVYDEIWEDDE